MESNPQQRWLRRKGKTRVGLSFGHSSYHGLCWLSHWVALSPRVRALTDPAAESGQGRGRGSQEGLMNSCSILSVQMAGLNPSTSFILSMVKSRFISSVAPLCMFNVNQGKVKRNHGSSSWPHRLDSCPEQVRTAY